MIEAVPMAMIVPAWSDPLGLLVAGAYLATFALVVYSRTYWALPAYLAAELFSLLVYVPGRMWVLLYVDPVVLTLQVAAALEAWLYVTWCIPGANERIKILIVALGVGAAGSAFMMYCWSPEHMTIPEWFGAWPPDPRGLTANQAKLIVHIFALSIAFAPALWEIIAPARKTIPGARAHAWTLSAYLAAFVVANSYFASGGMDEWDSVRWIFRIAILPCLALWCLQAWSAIRRAGQRALLTPRPRA